MTSNLRVVLGEWQSDPKFRQSITTPVEFVVAPSLRDEDLAPLTPHIAGWTEETFQHWWSTINDNLRRLAAGDPLVNVVKADRASQKT